ncbi:glycine cleavage system protein R [Ferrimonas balearica]|uniref:glycine cleavage system protein R n=1 Tax=Ferrimonas balearica TaxID=44012 RepID=UPI001C9A27D9|nr:ACT domain-containing protein [Ferrimonas balearica]MBY5993898.1 ACT domain-containing protein [Ferrimonas balearica]
MTALFLMTVMGPDRPGMLNQLAALTHQHQGKWLNSRMINLEGQFAAIIKVEVPKSQQQQLQEALMETPRMHLQIHDCHPEWSAPDRTLALQIDAKDQPGLINDITSALTSHGINVEQMECHRVASAEGGTLFTAELALSVPAELDPDLVVMELEGLHSHLMVQRL